MGERVGRANGQEINCMYFATVTDLIAMGGHGMYVWPAFGFAIFWMGYLLISPLLKKNRLLKSVYSQQEIEKNRK
jgi:heme exporter protein D